MNHDRHIKEAGDSIAFWGARIDRVHSAADALVTAHHQMRTISHSLESADLAASREGGGVKEIAQLYAGTLTAVEALRYVGDEVERGQPLTERTLSKKLDDLEAALVAKVPSVIAGRGSVSAERGASGLRQVAKRVDHLALELETKLCARFEYIESRSVYRLFAATAEVKGVELQLVAPESLISDEAKVTGGRLVGDAQGRLNKLAETRVKMETYLGLERGPISYDRSISQDLNTRLSRQEGFWPFSDRGQAQSYDDPAVFRGQRKSAQWQEHALSDTLGGDFERLSQQTKREVSHAL